MNKIKKAEILILFVSFCFSLFSCNKFIFLSSKNKILQKEVLPQIKNFQIIKTKNGFKLWEMIGEDAVLNDKSESISISFGVVKIYDNQKCVATAKFQDALLDVKSGDIIFNGENVIHTVENEKIITYDMKYISKENKIFSDKRIRIYKDQNIIEGIGFETTDGFKNIKIFKNVITPG